mgnify:CR=1 FL=1
MPKGYLIANIRVNDAEKFKKFSGMAGPVIKKFGGCVLVRASEAERREGTLTGNIMIIEFSDLNAAREFYLSQDYRAAKALREECSDTDLMLVEGLS